MCHSLLSQHHKNFPHGHEEEGPSSFKILSSQSSKIAAAAANPHFSSDRANSAFMAELKSSPSPSSTFNSSTGTTTRRRNLCSGFLLLLVVPIAISVILYQFIDFDPAPLPEHSLSWAPVTVSNHNSRILEMSERIGEGELAGPEDLAYDPESGFIYTTCEDGWIKRVKVTDSGSDDELNKVENWVHIGGRPLGIVFGQDKQLIIAESFKGLFKVTKDGEVELLTDEADGLKFKLTDGVDVAKDGMIYFTDASYKYSLAGHMADILEGRPYGRFMSYDPSTKETRVLVRDLYFANGVAVSPKNDFVVYCESALRSCSKYHIEGEKKGLVESFVDNLPGYPDNIRYDGEGRYWIALAMGKPFVWDVIFRYPFVRKIYAMLANVGMAPHMQRDGGVLSVDLDGKMVSLYTDSGLSAVTGGIKIGDHLYYGSLIKSYISRLDLNKQAA